MKTWRDEAIDKNKQIQNTWPLMDTTGIGSQQLCVEAQRICVRKLLRDKLRSDLRLKINEAAAMRKKRVQEGKLTKETKSITGQHQNFCNLDSLLVPDETITKDPIQIHDRLTKAFVENFTYPQRHKHSPLQSDNSIEHERLLTDEEYFKITA